MALRSKAEIFQVINDDTQFEPEDLEYISLFNVIFYNMNLLFLHIIFLELWNVD